MSPVVPCCGYYSNIWGSWHHQKWKISGSNQPGTMGIPGWNKQLKRSHHGFHDMTSPYNATPTTLRAPVQRELAIPWFQGNKFWEDKFLQKSAHYQTLNWTWPKILMQKTSHSNALEVFFHSRWKWMVAKKRLSFPISDNKISGFFCC